MLKNNTADIWPAISVTNVTSKELQEIIEKISMAAGNLVQDASEVYATLLADKNHQTHKIPVLKPSPLIIMLMHLPRQVVRELLRIKMKETLLQHEEKYPLVFKQFTPFSGNDKEKGAPKVIDEIDLLNISDAFYALSEAALLYHSYTGDSDYFSAPGPGILLRLCRFWNYLLKYHNNATFLREGSQYEKNYEKIAVNTIKLTLARLEHLKRDDSWMFEDLRERLKFSEIRETADWKEIIESPTQKSTGTLNDNYFTTRLAVYLQAPGKIPAYFQQKFGPNAATLPQEEQYSAWLSLMSSCTGFSAQNDLLSLTPDIPEFWKSGKFILHFREQLYHIEISATEATVENPTTEPVKIVLNNQVYNIEGNAIRAYKLK